MTDSPLYNWFAAKEWTPLPFQLETWKAISEGKSGILQADPGTGKTYAMMGGFCERFKDTHKKAKGLQVLWISPLRTLAFDLTAHLQRMIEGTGFDWSVGCRTGDTSAKEKAKQSKQLPEVLITTPESLHLLLAKPNYHEQLKNLKAVVIDEWHELEGTKRGVQIELALSHLHGFISHLQIWGLSATMGSAKKSLESLCGTFIPPENQVIVSSALKKEVSIETLIPQQVDSFSWAGHLALRSLPALIPLLEASPSSLIFTNTRTQAELWYQKLTELKPEWSETIGIHHGSLDNRIRKEVEKGLHTSELKVVICTSSLDLGVDFHPVELVVQVGSPKSIARCLQRAGRSGHRPGKISRLIIVPSQSLELVEALALKKAVAAGECESKPPLKLCFDVLIQYLLTLSVGQGFDPDKLFEEVKNTATFKELTEVQWKWILDFLSSGGEALQAYPDYQKIKMSDRLYKMTSPLQIKRHRLSIGTMMDHPSLPIRYLKGEILGTLDEEFATRLKPGDLFWYNGKCLKFNYLREMTVWVRKAKNQPAAMPRWRGERMRYSSLLSSRFAKELQDLKSTWNATSEGQALHPLLQIQEKWSLLPSPDQFLIETLHSKEGYHLFFYPFEGRIVHEALAKLIAYRLSQKQPFSFSMTSNDYGFELVSDQPIPFDAQKDKELFSVDNLREDLNECLKKTELASYHFREIARIAGLLFTGYPGKPTANRHLQMSAGILFNVFQKYDPSNLLLQQCYQEVLEMKWDLTHLEEFLNKVQQKEWMIKDLHSPTPFGFPLFVEQWRDQLSSEQLKERVEKMSFKLQNSALKDKKK